MIGTIERTLDPGDGAASVSDLMKNGGRLQLAYAWFPKPGEPPEVLYLAAQAPRQPFVLLRCTPPDATRDLPSLAAQIPLLGWYEREVQELCGVNFYGHPEPRPLVLHEGAHPSMPPLDPRYQPRNDPIHQQPWGLPPIEGDDVQMLPFGPVRADVLESAQILFYYIGEAILHCHPRLFFKHRGMEKRFEGLSPAMGVLIAERISGVDSVAHALAYCQAIESACGCVDSRSGALFAHDPGGIGAALQSPLLSWPPLSHNDLEGRRSPGQAARGTMQADQRSAHRKPILAQPHPAGRTASRPRRRSVAGKLRLLEPEISTTCSAIEETNSHLDRLITTGHLPQQMAFDQGATGPVKRASGIQHDLRCDYPYAAYDKFHADPGPKRRRRARSRTDSHGGDPQQSLSAFQCCKRHTCGPHRLEDQLLPGGEGLGWCEGTRGSTYYCVHLDRAAD